RRASQLGRRRVIVKERKCLVEILVFVLFVREPHLNADRKPVLCGLLVGGSGHWRDAVIGDLAFVKQVASGIGERQVRLVLDQVLKRKRESAVNSGLDEFGSVLEIINLERIGIDFS